MSKGSPNGPVFKKEPRHDWASHPADAFRYLAVSIKEAGAAKEKKHEVKYVYPGQQQQSWMR
jgi:phage terminase large subunit